MSLEYIHLLAKDCNYDIQIFTTNLHRLVDQLVSDTQRRVDSGLLPYKVIHCVGDLLIRLSVNEEMQIEGLQDQFSDAIRRVVLARKHELIHYANQRAAGSNLNAFDWQIRNVLGSSQIAKSKVSFDPQIWLQVSAQDDNSFEVELNQMQLENLIGEFQRISQNF